MSVRSVTVEFLRIGEQTGVLRPSDHYIRTIGDGPASEVSIPIGQERLNSAMAGLDYSNFLAADAD